MTRRGFFARCAAIAGAMLLPAARAAGVLNPARRTWRKLYAVEGLPGLVEVEVRFDRPVTFAQMCSGQAGNFTTLPKSDWLGLPPPVFEEISYREKLTRYRIERQSRA